MKRARLARAARSLDPWLIVALGLGGWLRLSRVSDFDNAYYTATVTSMLRSPHNFLFASSDPGGFVMVDKPPLAFWVQAVFPYLFGVSRWAVNLPQALAGILAVALVYWAVRRTFGRAAGVAAALTLAALPASIVIDSRNEPDGLLALVLLLAALCVIGAARTGRWLWVMVFAALMGLAFNIKMLVAFVPLPAFLLYYLLASRLPARRLAFRLAPSLALLLVVSLSWVSLVALTPKEQRPYVGSTRDNSIWTLTFKYNGLDRFASFIGRGPAQASPSPGGGAALPPGGQPPGAARYLPPQGGASPGPAGPGAVDRGLLGLLYNPLAAQLGWLLPLALLAMAVALMSLVSEPVARRPVGFLSVVRESNSVSETVLWVGWLATGIVVFGLANATTTHPYYLVGVAVPLAAVVGIGFAAAWRIFRQGGPVAWLLPVGLVAALTYQVPASRGMVGDWVVAMVLAAAFLSLALMAASTAQGLNRTPLASLSLAVGALSLLAIPMAFGSGYGGQIAGPGPGVQRPPQGAPPDPEQRLMESVTWFLDRQAESGGACTIAVLNAREASPLIVGDLPAMAIGGFSGNDPVFALESFKQAAEQRGLRCFLMPRTGNPGAAAGPPGGTSQQPILDYVRSTWKDESSALGLPRGAFYTYPTD